MDRVFIRWVWGRLLNALRRSKKMEQISFPLSSSFNHSWVNEQRVEMVERWGIKPHWNLEIGELSLRCLNTRE